MPCIAARFICSANKKALCLQIDNPKSKNRMIVPNIVSKSSIITRDLQTLAEQTGNIYASLVVASKRAKQISTAQKEELSTKLAQFATTVDNLEEVFENREQIEISKYYERLPKPSTVALDEFSEGKVRFWKAAENEPAETE